MAALLFLAAVLWLKIDAISELIPLPKVENLLLT